MKDQAMSSMSVLLPAPEPRGYLHCALVGLVSIYVHMVYLSSLHATAEENFQSDPPSMVTLRHAMNCSARLSICGLDAMFSNLFTPACDWANKHQPQIHALRSLHQTKDYLPVAYRTIVNLPAL